MAMDNSSASNIFTTLLLELSKAYRSMRELGPVLLSALKQLQTSIHSEGLSIWLLNETESELECTHAVGSQAAGMMGSSMRAKKFVAVYRSIPTKQLNIEHEHHSKWMDAQVYHDYFNVDAHSISITSLAARDKLIGMFVVVNQNGGTAFTSSDRDFINKLSMHIAYVIQNTQLYERQGQAGERQKLLNQISRYLHQTLDIDELIPRIFAEVNKAIHAESQSIWLVNEGEGVIKCRFATGPESEILEGFSVSLDASSIVGISISSKKSIIIKDAQNDPRRARSADEKTGFITRSLMTVPLVLDDKSIGAIQAVNKRGGGLFDQGDLDLFRSIADSAALAVSNAQLVADLQDSYDLTLAALSAALDLRDHETQGHSRRVVEYTARLARQVGLDNESIKIFRRGALIHDIGKIGVPDLVLNKPDSLSKEERKIIERHPQVGYYTLAGIPYLKEEIKIVVCHHEKWDGTGYPFGLRGEQIPQGARLFAIADTFDALTSNRPYREGRSYETARKIIEEESGRQFDPQAVAAFLAIPADEWTQIRAQVMDDFTQQRGFKDK